jgi:ABC-type sugar transport system ATPase subunit
MSALIQVRDLLIRRGGRNVLEVSRLDVHEGEVITLVGPNGAGKTTLLLAIANLLKLDEGEIVFANRPLPRWNASEYRRRISIVFQAPLLLDMTVADNVGLGLRFRGVSRDVMQARVGVWLERLGIASLAKRRAGQLSGGEAQRVSLARAFVLEPELLLLDEPFPALDPPARQRLVEDLSALLEEHPCTTMLVTHNLSEATKLSQRVAVIVAGQLRQADTPRRVKARPADKEVAMFLKEVRS